MLNMEGSSMRELLIINGLCLLIAIGALGIAVWAVLSGQVLAQGVDGLFLVVICLLTAFTFALPPLRELRQTRLRELLKRKKFKPSEAEQAQVVLPGARESQER